eukprot:4634149-Amphidinium_carterae.1
MSFSKITRIFEGFRCWHICSIHLPPRPSSYRKSFITAIYTILVSRNTIIKTTAIIKYVVQPCFGRGGPIGSRIPDPSRAVKA